MKRRRALRDDLAKSIGAADKVLRWALVRVRWQEYLPERSAEGVHPTAKIHALQDVKLPFVQAHMTAVVKINQPRIKGAVVGRGKRKAVYHVIRASVGTDWQNVRRVYQTELHTGHRAAVAVGEKDLLTEAGQAGQTAHFLHYSLPLRGQNLHLLRGGLLKMGYLVQQPQNIRLPSVAVKEYGIAARLIHSSKEWTMMVLARRMPVTVFLTTALYSKVELHGERSC